MSPILFLIMISKRIANKHPLKAYSAVLIGAALGVLGCVALNRIINDRVVKNCNLRLYEIIQVSTGIGASYHCVSKAVLYGPHATLKP